MINLSQITAEPSNQNTIAEPEPEPEPAPALPHTIQDVLLGKITLEELSGSEMA
ncbi:hypothetical protein AB0L88_18220 [Saccharopolyspora shandongensis]|uniref:hypothetical protein n=1 Tax=Saccharopolyspora shandongensis TaxID=418495 RepID=UPI003431FC24